MTVIGIITCPICGQIIYREDKEQGTENKEILCEYCRKITKDKVKENDIEIENIEK